MNAPVFTYQSLEKPNIDQLPLVQATVFSRSLYMHKCLGIKSTQTWRSGQNLGTWAPLQFWNKQGDIKITHKPLVRVFWVCIIYLVSLGFSPELVSSCNRGGGTHFLKTKFVKTDLKIISFKTHTMNMQRWRQPSKWFRIVNGASPYGPNFLLIGRAGLHMQDILEMCWTLQPSYALL